MITIEHVDKFTGPFYGYCSKGVKEDKIKVLASLTAPERAFVVAHEYYHSQDSSASSMDHWWLRELKATLLPLCGFVMLTCRTIYNWRRLAAYINRKGR